MKIILIRHGLTDYNLQKRYCGFKDIGLNKIGKARVKRLKPKLKKLKIYKVFCSDLKRSWQTAKIIFGNRGCQIVKNPNLREINFGKWEGLQFREILKKYPVLYKDWLKDPFKINIPAGEEMRKFVVRIRKTIKNIIRENSDKTVALICHLGTMRVILNTALGIKKNEFWKIEVQPEAIYVIKHNSLSKPKVYRL